MIRSSPVREGYPWEDAAPSSAHAYLLPALEKILAKHVAGDRRAKHRVLDLGCGNGAVTAWLADRGFDVVGVDPSAQGIEQARSAHPELEFHEASAYDPLREDLGRFQLVISLEVVEHLYDPPHFARTALDLLSPGGLLVLSTPYHGWLKNVAIALLGRFDDHANPLRVHGHIKFWSRRTLTRLLQDAGFHVLEFHFAGRVRPVAKSMVAVARRPATASRGAPQEHDTDAVERPSSPS